MNPPGAEPPLRDFEPAPFAEEHVARRHADVLEHHLSMSVRRIVVAEDVQHPHDRHAGRIARDEDHRLLLVAIGIGRIRLAHEDEHLAARVADA